MLFSPAHQVAFAHYPKTAGCSMTNWFRKTCPDARHVEAGNCHMPVREALERLGPLVEPVLSRWQQWLPHQLRQTAGLRIIGVMREPFEMLVSLYEYWRRFEFTEEPDAPLIRTARSKNFCEFLRLAIGERQLANYETFFDVGGPAWETTRLIDFHTLESGLAAVCQEFDLMPSAGLLRLNAAHHKRSGRDLGGYLAEASPFFVELRSHFRWYYAEGVRIMVKGYPAAVGERKAA